MVTVATFESLQSDKHRFVQCDFHYQQNSKYMKSKSWKRCIAKPNFPKTGRAQEERLETNHLQDPKMAPRRPPVAFPVLQQFEVGTIPGTIKTPPIALT